MPNYTYNCPNCGRIERNGVPVDARKDQVCECGAQLEYVFDPRAVCVAIPIYMQAGHEDRFPADGLAAKTEAQRQIQRECDARPENSSQGWF